jgi:hypothetical protein
MPQQRKTSMSKHEAKLEQKSPAKPDSIAKDAELSEEQLKEVSGGFLGFFIGHGTEATKPTGPSGPHVRKAGGDQQEY